MNRLPRLVLLLACVLLPSGVTAEECGWLAPSELDRLFPDHAPWRVMTGGEIGSCRFLSRPAQPANVFGANQVVLSTAAEAADYVLNLRTQTEKNLEITPIAELGEHGFAYSGGPPAAGGDPRSVSYVGHRGTVAVIGSLSLQQGVSTADRNAGAELIGFALAVADDEQALAGASDCPWFETSSLERMLTGGGLKQQVLGETSCMAQDDANAVLLVSVTGMSEAMLARRGGGCTWEDLPELGSGAVTAYSCSEGNPRALVRLAVGDRLVEYTLVPGPEPTADQRQALVGLARHALDTADR